MVICKCKVSTGFQPLTLTVNDLDGLYVVLLSTPLSKLYKAHFEDKSDAVQKFYELKETLDDLACKINGEMKDE